MMTIVNGSLLKKYIFKILLMKENDMKDYT